MVTKFIKINRDAKITVHGQNAQNIEMQSQLQAIRTQLQGNQNADCTKSAVTGVDANVRELAQTLNCDFNALKGCCCDVRAGISRFGDQIGYRAEQAREIQDLKNENSNLKQTQYLAKLISGNGGCGCGNGCGL